MDENNRNFILAIVLSIVVLVGWQYFYGVPKMQEEQARKEREAQLQKQEQTAGQTPAPSATGVPQPATPGPVGVPTPSGPAAAAAARDGALKSSVRIPIETRSLRGSVALTGARIDDLVLKKYRETVDPESRNVVLFSPSGSASPYYAEHGWAAVGGAKLKLPNASTVWTTESPGPLTPETPLRLTWDNGEGLTFRRTISVDDDYLFTVRQEVVNNTGAPVSLYPYALISRHGTPQVQGFFILHEGLIGVLGQEGEQKSDYDDILEDKVVTFENIKGGWIGITDKYWAAAVIPDQTRSFQARFSGGQTGVRPTYQSDYLLEPISIPAGGAGAIDGRLFAGAKEVTVIDGYAERFNIANLDLLIDWGWFYFLTKPLFFALDYFFKLVGNFGLSILIVTVVIKLVLFPLANKSYVSMSKMKKLQPEMQKIKERFENDRTRQQQALMDLYKKEKVNPASGCLPILVQIPVFFALYKVLFITIEMRHAPFYGWIKDLSAPDPTSLFNLFGLLPYEVPLFLLVGVWPIIMGVTMFVQMKLNPAPPDPIQAKIFTWMPLFFTFLLASFPAGLVIYWAWNNLLSIIQQWVIMHRMGVEVALWDNLGINKKKGVGASRKT